MKFIAVITTCAALLAPFTAWAEGEKVIANIMVKNAKEGSIILVDKTAKKMFNIKVNGDKAQVMSEFPIMYGSSDGDKMVRGDNKTPEGVYYITTYTSGDMLVKQYGNYAKIYGAGSFPLNYPNPVDRINKKTGHGIWIHGTNPLTDKNATQGCVAMKNEDFNALKADVKIKYPVIITDNITYLTPEGYDNLSTGLTQRFKGFIDAWGGSDFEKFKGYIHDNYQSAGGVNAKRYLSTKESLMKIYPNRVVETASMRVMMKDPTYVVFETEQFYCAPNITTLGDKRYYFNAATDGQLKLISEEFTQKDVKPYIDKSIEKFVNSWAMAWESQNIDEYMKFYSKKFDNPTTGKYEDWKKYKNRLFGVNKKISVKVKDIEWRKVARGYVISFKQDYSSDTSSDKGIKTIILEGCPTEFGILSETWTAR